MSLEEAALIEPLAVAVRACQRSGNMKDKKVLVTGAGPIGLCVVVVAKAMGASTIGMIDYARRPPAESDQRLQNRLTTAKKLGVDCCIIADLDDVPGTVSRIKEAMGVPDIVIENIGRPTVLEISASCCISGGVVVVTGVPFPPKNVQVNVFDLVAREVDIRGSVAYPTSFKSVVDMVASGQCDVKQLITQRFPLAKAPDAFNLIRHGQDVTIIKVLIQCDKIDA